MNTGRRQIIRNCRRKRVPKKCATGEVVCESITLGQDLSVRSACTFDMDERGTCIDIDCDSEPDRSNPLWKIQPPDEHEDESKQDSSADVKPKLTVWEEVMIEYEDKRQEFFNALELSSPYEPPFPVCSKLSAVQYLEKYIFPLLCPILEETLYKAKEWECLMIQKCRFNGLDYISELLWNRNPLHFSRRGKHRDIFDIPFVIIWLYFNPRPIYPLSWLWSKEEAVIVLQTYIRRYLVCKEQECSEMRQFWKTIKMEEEEKKRAKFEKLIEQLEIMFNEILDKLVADAVFEAEWKIYGCRCVKKPCKCVCKCMKWCKCCTCYKTPVHDTKACSCSKLEQVLRTIREGSHPPQGKSFKECNKVHSTMEMIKKIFSRNSKLIYCQQETSNSNYSVGILKFIND